MIMRDIITAKERLSNPNKIKFIKDALYFVCLMSFIFYLLIEIIN
jgi:hypothetical protein